MRPALIIGWLFALALASVFTSLGFWQYGRGEAKAAFLVDWQAALQASPQPLAPWQWGGRIAKPAPVKGTLEALSTGRWLLLDNARRGAQVGLRAYYVATVDNGMGLLVDAGWLPFDRAKGLPELPLLPDAEPVEGLLVPWPGQGIALGEATLPPAGEPALLLRLDREALAADAGLALVDGVLRLAPSADAVYARDLDALPNTLPPEKHYGYALQWWGLACAAIIVATVLTFRRRSP